MRCGLAALTTRNGPGPVDGTEPGPLPLPLRAGGPVGDRRRVPAARVNARIGDRDTPCAALLDRVHEAPDGDRRVGDHEQCDQEAAGIPDLESGRTLDAPRFVVALERH